MEVVQRGRAVGATRDQVVGASRGRAVDATRGRAWLGAAAIVVAVAVHTWAQSGMVLGQGTDTLRRMRSYYSPDQLGYLSITVNVANGHSAEVEPFTETGTIHYPRLYYILLGHVARLLRADPIVVWNVAGLIAQAALVAVLGLTLIVLGRLWWLALLAPLPFLVGTFSWLTTGDWLRHLGSHAVLWGAFGVLHTLNGEVFALCVAGICCLGLLWVWVRPHRRIVRVIVTVVAALGIGALGNVETYAFLVAVYFVVFTTGAWAMLAARRWVLLGASVALMPVVFLAGPHVSSAFGQLAALVFGLLPAVPGVVAVLLRTRGFVVVYYLAGAVAAAPQLVDTLSGLAAHDPFLLYRVVVLENLGVPVVAGLIGGAALLVPLVLIGVAALARRNALWGAYTLGVGPAWFLLATNDRWGVNAEPYRLWLDGFTLVANTVVPVGVLVLVDGRWMPQARTVVACGAALTIAVAGVSAVDWTIFYRAPAVRELLTTSSPRQQALAELAEFGSGVRPGELLVSDPCISPAILKVTSGTPIASFRIGMAWPTDYQAIGKVMRNRARGNLDVPEAVLSNSRLVITDSACGDDWGARYSRVLHEMRHIDYEQAHRDGRVTLWELRPGG